MTGSLIEEAEATVRVRNVLRGVAAAAALVGSGVATNQVLDQGKLSWNWLYLAFLLSVLALLASAQPPSPPPADDRENRRGAYPRWRAYLRQVRASVADMETIGLATQGEFVLRTRQVYVDVALRRRPPHETAGDGVLGDAADRAAAGLSAVGERRPLADFLVPNRVLAVLGAPGSGKTTLVRHTALEMAERPLARRFRSRRRLPVLLYLRDHTGAITAGEPADLAEVAVAAAWLSGAVPAVWLRRWLERGRCVVLLDGLDEVADGGDRRKVVRWVTAQMARFPGNCFVVTSRPHGYLTNPLTADVLQVQRFTPDQVKAFLQTWYRTVEGRARQGAAKDVHAIADRAAEDLLARLHGTPALLDLTANPLLLTMIALVHRYRGALPGSRAELYAEICDVLLSRRQEAKNLADPTGLRGSQKEAVLRHLALHMMRRRLRDISAADAEEVVKARLSEVTGRLAPKEFLRQISTSGLLVEREHGIYSFAHLTFQEHLAAALIRAEDRYLPLLTGGVDDPWWRETTLLWAARSDATPVIDACLDSGTVRALSLAFDCADQAERLSPASRDRLDQVLDAPQDADPERLRLIAAVTASRALHDTIRLPGGAGLCTRPVTPRLWRLFAQQTGRVTTPSADTGIWATDVKNFITWVNSLFDDGTTYRVPTRAEITTSEAGALPAMRSHAIWHADDHGGLRLHHPGMAHPYAPTAAQVAGYPELILDHTHLALRLPTSPLTITSLIAYGQFATREPRNDLINALELAITLETVHGLISAYEAGHANVPGLAQALDLVRARARALAGDGALALGSADSALARGAALNRARVLARDSALSRLFRLGSARPHVRTLVRALAEALDRTRSSLFDLDRASVRALDGNPDLARALDLTVSLLGSPGLGRNPDPALNLAHDSALHLAFALDLTLALDLTVALDRPRTFTPGLDNALDSGLGVDRTRALTLDRTLGPVLDRALDRALSGSLDSPLGFDLHLAGSLRKLGPAPFMDLTADLAWARAFVRTVDPESDGRTPLIATLLVTRALLASWKQRPLQNRAGRRPTSLEGLLAAAVDAAADAPEADDPFADVVDVWEHLEENDTDEHSLALIENACRLLDPMVNRRSPVLQRDLVLAGAAILGALSFEEKEEIGRSADAARRLRAALRTLIALTPASENGAAGADNAVLLLVR